MSDERIVIEAGGTLTLPPRILRELRAPVGTEFSARTAGTHLLLLFREHESVPEMAQWVPKCSLVGSISTFSIADLFSTLNMGQKTGVILFESAGHAKRVYFERGEIVFAESTQPEHRLGTILVQRGLLSQAQLDAVLKQRSDGVRLGARLIQRGLIKPKDLYEAVRYQVEEIIYSIFPASDGIFYFFEGDFLDEDLSQFTLNTQNILMEGYRRLDEWGVVREKIPHEGVVILPVEGAAPAKYDSPAMEQVYALIDGKRTVKQLMQASKLGEFDLYRALYDLLKRGAIETVDPKQASVGRSKTLDSVVESYNRLFMVIGQALEKSGRAELLTGEAFAEFVSGMDERSRKLLERVRFDTKLGIANSLGVLLESLDKAWTKGKGMTKIAGLDDLFKRQQLQAVLDELLNYLLFTVKNALPPEQADQFITKVRGAHKRLREGL